MPNMNQCARIICPYFLRLANNGRGVICEGLVPGSEITNSFRRQEDKDIWVAEVCETHGYAKRCLLAQAIESKHVG